ncbi:MAG: hypothetical protein ACXVFK_01800 [Solirubrobacteraceae bacterium]
MDAVSSERPFYLRAGRDHVFCVAHGSPVGTGVVLSPPFGREDVASYRARRLLAMRLATGGRLVLRFDPPGAGDSSGMPTDPGRLDAWCSALAAAESWLRDAGCSRVACLGIGLGGLVALRALGDAASFDELALWGTPRNGRLAVRELQAFSRLQSDRAPDPPGALPGDVIEAGGHVMSSETAEAVRAIDPSAIRAPSLRRALVLARPGVSSDARLADALAELGLPVTRADGGAYAAMTEHPQTSELPEGAAAALSAWLAAGLQPTGSPAPAPPRPREWAGERVREARVASDAGDGAGALPGVLSSPAAAPGTGVGLVLFNAGAIRRTGPSRLWVEVARAWAAEGSEVLRLDLDEIGDSGAPGHVLPTPALYAPERRVQAEAAVAWMLGLPAVDRVVVAGLCVGGSLAFHTATRVAASRLGSCSTRPPFSGIPRSGRRAITRGCATSCGRRASAPQWRCPRRCCAGRGRRRAASGPSTRRGA